MKHKIYVPANFAFPEMLGNIEKECERLGFDLVKTSEKICIEHTLLNRGSLALLSPIGYGMGVKKTDFRIVPTTTASFAGYSGRASLYFRPGLSSITNIGVKDPDDFIVHIGKILLSERYDIEAIVEKTNLNLPEIFDKYESAILEGNNHEFYSMDISEDWFETFEIPLTVGVWVVRNEEEPDDVAELTRIFALDELPEEIDCSLIGDVEDGSADREGKIITKWNDDTKSAFEQTLELLYYHRVLPELPAIKIYGID